MAICFYRDRCIQYVKSSDSNLPKKQEKKKQLRTWFSIASKA
ncbi:hypothetical protein T11_16760 [Trichinella zimbabwensis]|uniref:Uncharacterized protein n=1 Tax=Trichinella zimbabwensis TaxID=268475 RepID=A0A0V1G8C1_9BILA|nr:hypothetical protein T11_16760 [Trichinella zimbabwensis]